jgi:aminopeptidase N
MLDLRGSAKEYPLTVEELVALTKQEDFATAQRANRLLRRVSASAAAPILWERLAKLSQRSQVQEVEDEILRLPVSQAAKHTPVEFTGTSLASKAAWVRIVGVRASKSTKVRTALKASLLPLLKGPANELTEAAWAAVPRLFVEADRAALTEAAQGLSERLAPKAKAALDALSAK